METHVSPNFKRVNDKQHIVGLIVTPPPLQPCLVGLSLCLCFLPTTTYPSPASSPVQVRARVDEVLAQVDLTERFGDLVGTPGTSGLPTEARKRLTIAVELMANPPVLFMDEPTSGEPGSSCYLG